MIHSVTLSSIYDWGGFNRELFSIINGFRGPAIDALALANTRLGDVSNALWILSALVLLAICGEAGPQKFSSKCLPAGRKSFEVLAVFAVGCAVTALLVFSAKAFFNMPRPYMVLPPGSVNVLAKPTEPYSLPSGHSALAMLVACVFWPYGRKWWRGLLALCVCWVGISRVSVGAHFPADVLAGYLCGGIGAWFARPLVLANSRVLPRQFNGRR